LGLRPGRAYGAQDGVQSLPTLDQREPQKEVLK